jgi:tripartite-type tricarboxylate transporter receptor subunit TctC
MKTLGIAGLVAAGFLSAWAPAQAQDYPTRPITIVAPYAPGGATDIVARTLGEQLRKDLGQSIVVENKPGAFGILAIERMVRAKPDGHTLMLGNVTTNAITPILFPKKFSIDYATSVVPVTRLVDIPEYLLVTRTNFPPSTVEELVSYARENPGKVRYATTGIGSYAHFDMALFAKRAGIDMVHVPVKAGASGVMKDMANGDLQVSFVNVATSASMIEAGKVKPIAIVADKRLPEQSHVPTMAELGYPGVGTIAWQGLFASAETPRPVLEKLHAAVLKSLETQELKDAFARQHFRLVPNASVDEANTWLKTEIDNWRSIADEVKLDIPQ